MRDKEVEERFFPGIDTLNSSKHLYGEAYWDEVDDQEEDDEEDEDDSDSDI